MKRVPLPATLCLLLAVLGGCASTARQPDREQLVAQVTAAETAFAKTMADRDHAAFLTFVAEDAVFLGGSDPLRGKAAVGDGWKRFYTQPAPPFSWKPELVEVIGSGKLALSTGPVFDPAGKLVSRYYSTWRLEPDGRWRVVLDNGYDVCDCTKK